MPPNTVAKHPPMNKLKNTVKDKSRAFLMLFLKLFFI